MTPSRRRVTVAVSLTTVLISTMLFLVVDRVRHWQARGMVGLAYVQVQVSGKPAPNLFAIKPGHVMMVYPGGPADHAGIVPRDEIVSINGFKLTDRSSLVSLNRRLRVGDPVTYRLRRGKTEFEKVVQLEPAWPRPLMVTSVIVFSTVAFAFIAIGLFVFTRAPTDRRSTVFYAMVTIGALSLLSSAMVSVDVGSLRGILADAEQPNVVAIVLLAFFSLLFFPLTLHLALVFPKDRPALIRNPRLLRWVYGLPVGALLLVGLFVITGVSVTRNPDKENTALEFIFKWGSAIVGVAGLFIALRLARIARTEGFRDAFWFRPLQSLVSIFALLIAITRIFAALKLKAAAVVMGLLTVAIIPVAVVAGYPVLSCILLWRSYRDAGAEERRQVKWPVWGTLIAVGSKILFGIATYAIMFVVLGSGRDLNRWIVVTTALTLIPIVLYLLIPISFAVAILKYRLMNIDVIIKKTVVYAILSGAIIVLYLVLVGGLGTILIAVAGVKNQTMVVASTLVVAALFVPLRNRLQHLVDRNLFREKIDYPQALRAIAANTVAASDIQSFLNVAVEKLQQALQNRAVVIFQRRGEEMVATAKIGVPDAILGSALSATTAETFDRPLDPRRRELPDHDSAALRRAGTALVVPVRSHSSVVALVALGTKLSDRDFDLDDIEFAASAADQIALGIDRIRTQHDEADFEQARALQQTLLPTEAPTLAGLEVAGVWQPARTVGGDYYDLLKLSDTQLGICIGDVAGKGMPAALLMSGLQAAVRASADADVAPVRVCERVRRVIVPSLGGRFVTFFYCLYDAATQRLRYCNAGHNPPIVVRADGTTIRLTAGGSVFSRLFRNEPLHEAEVELRNGDRLVLFTDGVSEARDAAENDFTEERLEQFVAANRHLGAQDLASSILSAVLAYAGGRPEDDLTLVTMAVSGPA